MSGTTLAVCHGNNPQPSRYPRTGGVPSTPPSHSRANGMTALRMTLLIFQQSWRL